MNRRQLFRLAGRVTLGTLLASVLTEPAQPVTMGVDVATEGADTTVVSLHATDAATPDDLGGFLVPQEYVDELLAAMKDKERRSNVFRVDNSKQVHQSFAQFLNEGAA